MRKLGLIGGMSWASTELYYRYINRDVQRLAGGMHSAPLLLESLDFQKLCHLQADGDWSGATAILADSAKRLEQGGATAIIICANIMHKVYDDIAGAVSIPVIHIADCIGEQMIADGRKKAALIGTRNVMTEPFYRQKLVGHGIALLPPNMERVDEIDRIIYEELMLGKVTRDSERTLKTFMTNIAKEDVDSVILGCTELVMIVKPDANILPIYDGTRIHAEAAVKWILDQ